MPTTSVAVRIGVEGEPEIVRAGRTIKSELGGAYAAAGEAADQAGQKATAAIQKQEREAARARTALIAHQAAIGREQAQMSFNQLLGVSGGSAEASGLTAEYFAELERQERQAQAVRAAVDPLAAAQARYNAELAEARSLAQRKLLTDAELIARERQLKTQLDATTLALQNQERGLSRLALASRLNLGRQVADVGVTAAMGMNPGLIAIQQGPQILDAWATSGIKLNAAMIAAAGGIAAAASAAALGAVAYAQGADRMERLDRAALGLGRTAGLTGEELEALAEAAGRSADVSLSAAEEQAAAYIATGRIGGEMIGDLIAVHRDFAAAVGLDGPEATSRLAQSFADPIAGARALNQQLWFLDQTTLRHIQTMAREGDQLGAQRLLMDELADAVQGLGEELNDIETLWQAIGRAASNAFHEIGDALWQSDSERLNSLEALQQLHRLDSREREIEEIRARMARREAQGEEAEANRREAQNAALIGRYDPQSSRAELEADRASLIGLRGNPDHDQVALERSITALDRRIRDLGRTARETRSEAERLQDRLDDMIASAFASADASNRLTEAWLGVATASGDSAAALEAERLGWAATAAEREIAASSIIDGMVREEVAYARLREAIAGSIRDHAQAAGEMAMETAIRRQLTAEVEAGTLAIGRLDQEAELRALRQQFTIDALSAEADELERLTAAYGAHRQAIADAADAERDLARVRMIAQAANDADDLMARIGLIEAGASDAQMRLAEAERGARRALEERGDEPDSAEGRRAIEAARREAQAGIDLDRAEAARRVADEIERETRLVQVQLNLVGQDERTRERILRRVALINDLLADGLALEDERVQAILRAHDAYEGLSDMLERQMGLSDELRDLQRETWNDMKAALRDGEEGWRRFGDIAEEALQRIIWMAAELAVFNPLENWAVGSNLPTWNDVGGFGNFIKGIIPGFAGGTDDAPEGFAWVGEHGKELVGLPEGARVLSHARSVGLASRERGSGRPIHITIGDFYAPGADAAALARLEARVDALPGQIIEMVGEADERLIIRRRGG